MLKRVALMADSEGLCRSARNAASDKEDVQVLRITPDMAVPAGTALLLADPESAEAAVNAAFLVGTWNEELLNFLADAIDCRESFLPGSSHRVMEHATHFALALGLSPDDRLTLERGALVRDIGKIGIPNEVLLKQGVLTYDEWRLLQQHPHLGEEMVTQTGVLRDTAAIVRNHHESFDGDGYPDGLEAEDIPYLARITKLLDVYCAMTSPRHYRQGHSSHEQAIEYLRNEQGKHFDPTLVDVFIEAKIGRTDAPEKDGKRSRGEKGRKGEGGDRPSDGAQGPR
jgi:HD-GYP domain-containing protein (c-di-GMP phosphodiesterase class II)